MFYAPYNVPSNIYHIDQVIWLQPAVLSVFYTRHVGVFQTILKGSISIHYLTVVVVVVFDI